MLNCRTFPQLAKDALTKFHAVAFDTTANTVTASTTADTGAIAGIPQDTYAAGQQAAIAYQGVCKAYITTASGIARGSGLQLADTSGGLKAATTAGRIVATALEIPGADGAIIEVLLAGVQPIV